MHLLNNAVEMGTESAWFKTGQTTERVCLLLQFVSVLKAIGSAVQLVPKKEHVGHLQFNASVLNTTVHPTVACQFRVGRYGIKYTSIRWKGGKFETHRSLYELTYSADEINGYIWSNLTIIHPCKYTC